MVSPPAKRERTASLDAELLDVLTRYLDSMPRGVTANDARQHINFLDERLEGLNQESWFSIPYRRGLSELRLLCGEAQLLPDSFKLQDVAIGPQAVIYGGFSDVHRGTYKDLDVALKVFRINIEHRDRAKKRFCRAAILWKRLLHPNILPFLGISDLFPLCMVSEWMPNGDIRNYLRSRPEANRLKWMQEIAAGLRFMHRVEVVHGDLKCANVLVGIHGEARLTDFDLAATLHHSVGFTTTFTEGGTARYMAPELFGSEDPDAPDCKPTKASDVYSQAILWWEMLTLKIPYPEKERDMSVMLAVSRGARPKRPTNAEHRGLTDDIWNLMERCWDADPQSRPGITSIFTELHYNIRISPGLYRFLDVLATDDASTPASPPSSADAMLLESISRLMGMIDKCSVDFTAEPSARRDIDVLLLDKKQFAQTTFELRRLSTSNADVLPPETAGSPRTPRARKTLSRPPSLEVGSHQSRSPSPVRRVAIVHSRSPSTSSSRHLTSPPITERGDPMNRYQIQQHGPGSPLTQSYRVLLTESPLQSVSAPSEDTFSIYFGNHLAMKVAASDPASDAIRAIMAASGYTAAVPRGAVLADTDGDEQQGLGPIVEETTLDSAVIITDTLDALDEGPVDDLDIADPAVADEENTGCVPGGDR